MVHCLLGCSVLQSSQASCVRCLWSEKGHDDWQYYLLRWCYGPILCYKHLDAFWWETCRNPGVWDWPFCSTSLCIRAGTELIEGNLPCAHCEYALVDSISVMHSSLPTITGKEHNDSWRAMAGLLDGLRVDLSV